MSGPSMPGNGSNERRRDDERSDDERLAAALRTAHRDEQPPAFGALVVQPAAPTPPRRRWALASSTAAAAIAACALVLWNVRDACPGQAPATVAYSFSNWQAPTDFLLETPGRDLLSTVPTFEVPAEIPKIPAGLEEKRQ